MQIIMSLFEQINNDIKEAMKARDSVRLEALRNKKSNDRGQNGCRCKC